nr:ribosomal protein S18-alanine N-acetyltransferase [Oculatella sp. LEGE 06141]
MELDQRCLGGLWTQAGYERELTSPNSDLLVLQDMSPETDSSSSVIGLGCLWAILEEAHITILAVHPDCQRQGFGQALLYALLILAWRRNLEWATLEVRDSNQAAISLYRKFGFRDVGKRRRYYQDTGEDALILWRNGLQKPEFSQIVLNWRQQVSDRLHDAGWSLIDRLPGTPLDAGAGSS